MLNAAELNVIEPAGLGHQSRFPRSQHVVTGVTVHACVERNNRFREALMPILMLALLALAAFGVIGVLLAVAAFSEKKG